MSASKHSTRNGLALAFVGGMLITVDIPLIRLAGSDPFVTMAARSGFLTLFFGIVFFTLRHRMNWPRNPFADPEWVMIGALGGLSNLLFTFAVFTTTTANLVFILAFNPMAAAFISWLILGERPALATWLAVLATTTGVFIIVSDGLGQGTWVGDLLALGCAIVLAITLTLIRRSGKDMSLTPGFGGMIVFCFSLPLTWLSPWPSAMGWLVLDAAIIVPVAAICLAIAPRLIPSPQVGLFYLLETVLAPLWVWWVFSEIPSDRAFVGGAIVIVAITGHSVWALGARRRLANARLVTP